MRKTIYHGSEIIVKERELSEASGCSLRMIQYYEQKVKDINKAQADTLLCLARVLRCPPEELLEYRPEKDTPQHI